MNKKRRIRAFSWILAMLLLVQDGAMAYAANIAGTESIVAMEEADSETASVSGNDGGEVDETVSVSENTSGEVDETVSDSGNGSGEEKETDDTNEVSGNDVATEEDLDYILGREMTPEEIAAQQAMVPNLVEMEVLELDAEDVYAGMPVNFLTELEESYDARTTNIFTDVRNQDPWGTCWAFTTYALVESSLVMLDLAERDSIDLSERHLAYFTGNTGYDALGNASEDTLTQPSELYYLDSGGNISKAAMRLMNWQGAALEEEYPYQTSDPEPIARENAQDIEAMARDVYFIPTKGVGVSDKVDAIKKLIKTYGAVGWSYYHHNAYYNYSTGAYNCTEAMNTNHAITLVGWDDNYKKENFLESCRPENDGAWIVRNSWGSDWGKSGYFYISYEDATLGEGNDASVIIADTLEKYDNNYFYGNGIGTNYYSEVTKIGQVFEAKSGAEKEVIKAVSFMLLSEQEPYEIQVYKNPTVVDGIVKNPESGEAMYTTPVTGTTGYAGVYTVDIPEVIVDAGDVFAVVVTFTDGIGASVRTDKNTTNNKIESKNVTEAGQSFLNFGYWYDLYDNNCSARMNVFTADMYGSIPTLRYKADAPGSFDDVLINRILWSKCIDAIGYEIYCSDKVDGNYALIDSVTSDVMSYQHEVDTKYWNQNLYYKVRAVSLDGTGSESEPLEIYCESIIPMSNIVVEKKEGKNRISWEEVSGADGYQIQRKLLGEEEYSDVVTLNGSNSLTYTDVLEEQSQVFEYRVRAYSNEKGSTMWSSGRLGAEIYLESDSHEWNDGTAERIYELTWDDIGEEYFYVSLYKDGEELFQYFAYKNYYQLARNDSIQVGEKYIIKVEPYYNIDNPFQTMEFEWMPTGILSVNHTYEDGEAIFTWSGADDATFIDIYRSTDANSHDAEIFASIDTAEATQFIDNSMNSGDDYYYWFYPGVMNSDGNKVYSEPYRYTVESPLSQIGIGLVSVNGEETDTLPTPLFVEDVIEVQAQYSPENADVESIQWSCDNVAVADVTDNKDGTATVTMLKAGEATLTVTIVSDGTEYEATYSLAAVTKPQKPKLVSSCYHSMVIEAEAAYEYAISKDANADRELLQFVSSMDTDTVTFDDLEENTTYYVFTRLQQYPEVYAETLEVHLPEKGRLVLSPNSVILTKGESRTVTYTVTTGETEEENLNWSASYSDGSACEPEKADDGSFIFKGKDGKEICKITGNTILATGLSETRELSLNAKNSNDKEGSLSLKICPIDKSVKLSAVTSKVYLEQFEHNSNDSFALKIQDKQGSVYNAEYFDYVSADTKVCIVDELGNVSVNPSYSGTKDKTVKVTASVKNDPAKRKVTFSVVVYGKQQMAQLEIVHAEDTPDTVAVEYGKNKTITLEVLAWGSNENPMTAPSVKWSVSNSAVATVKANKDGTATVTMKKPGQCSIICTANDSLKNSDSLLLKAIDITPILDKTTVKLQTKTASVEGWKVSESFTITSVYGAEYDNMEIASVKLGKTELTSGGSDNNYMLIDNDDGSYSLAVKDSAIGSLKHNNKLTVGIKALVKDTDEDVTISDTSFNMTLQIVTTEPSVTVKGAGTINRYYQDGENVRSLLTIKTNETIEDITLDGEEQNNDFDSRFTVEKDENGQWYLVLTDAGLTANSVKGKLFITLEGYETITKTITVKTPSKKPAFSQQSVPVININDSNSNQQADVVMLKNKKPAEYLYVESAGENAKADIEAIDGGIITMTLKEGVSYKHNETVSITARVWETNEAGSFHYEDPVLVTLKVKISTQAPKVTAKTKTLTLNNQASAEKVSTMITCNQNNLAWNTDLIINEYNSKSKKYDIEPDWLNVDLDEKTGNVSLQLADAKKAGTYKLRITNMLDGFEAVPLDLTVKVIDTAPTVTVKTSGKLDLTNLSACSLAGTLSFKNTVSTKIDADSLKVIDDDRFAASLTEEGKVALTVTDENKIEGNIAATKINVKLGFTLEGGTEIETVMQIKPVVTIPKLTIPAAKKLYKSIPNHTVSYNLGELLAEGAAISKIEIVSAPKQFEIEGVENNILNEDVVSISLKENQKGLKAGKYSFKVKVTFVGAPNKPQTKTIQVQLVE